RRDRTFERHRRVSEWLVDQIDPQLGQTIVEVAAGPGETGFLAAGRVGSAGRLISTDLAPGMVGAAARGARVRGLTNVECRVMDAQSMDLADDSADGMLCRFALMLMPEPQRMLTEARRVLREGGRLAYAVFGAGEDNPWITTLVDAFEETGHRLPTDMFQPGGSFFSLADHDRNRELLTAAGFADVLVEEFSDPRTYDGFEEYWDHHTHATAPIAALAERLSPGEAEVVREALRSKLARFQSSAGYEVPSAVVAARAA
ncbi:MAG: methyltransferase domain-containing protein, partial [Pseudonocardiales bacterium]|nr:methyltransferase domain-containing protein [Pseudonocardiales bacterium]